MLWEKIASVTLAAETGNVQVSLLRSFSRPFLFCRMRLVTFTEWKVKETRPAFRPLDWPWATFP